MPNWCSNSVTFYNEDVSKIDALEQELKKGEDAQIFTHFLPIPEGVEDWYSWNVNNWGTKWDANVYQWDREDNNTLSVIFDTAWSPPIAVYEHLTNENWNISAFYYEPGMGFIGKYENGDDQYYEYDITNLESIKQLPEDIIEYGNLIDEYEYFYEQSLEDEDEEPQNFTEEEESEDLKDIE